MTGNNAPGWYGKLPSLGDFASRRLDPDFIDPWDTWLAQGLADWQARAPGSWLDRYLAGPSWRFVLMPGTLPGPRGDSAWTGVLMPSVDRVGRYFPLTLVQPLPQLPVEGAQTASLLAWLQRLDDLATDALHDDWTIDQLEAELQRLGTWSPESPKQDLILPASEVPMLVLTPTDGVSALLGDMAGQALHMLLRGKVLWLACDVQRQPVMRLSTGLPQRGHFSDLLIGPGALDGALSTVLAPLST